MSRTTRIMSLLCLFLLCFMACEYEGPDAVWKPNPTGDANPIATSVEPADVAAPGIAKIKIQGENFSPILEENQVFFGSVEVDIYSATENELAVYRPNLVSDDITIRVVVRRALEDFPFPNYSVTAVNEKLYDMRELGNLNVLFIDRNENMFVHSNRKLYFQVLETGEFVELSKTLPRVVFDIIYGPNNEVYVGRDEKYLMKINPETYEFEKWAQGLPKKVKHIDFDSNLNIYAGGKKSGIIMVKQDESYVDLGGYENHEIEGVRVYNGELYVASAYPGEDALDLPFAIYKHTINSDGTLGEREVFVDWSETGHFAETAFTDFEFDEDGILLVSTDGGPGNDLDPMMMVYRDGTIDTFYKGGILTGAILGMTWGEDETLYYYQTDGTIFLIYEMGMAKQCAPRYGREN